MPLVELDAETFSLPIATYTRSYFLTARLAARRMVASRSGVIMTVTALHSRIGIPLVGGYQPSAVRQGIAYPKPVRRTRTSWHSRGRFAPAGHARDGHDQTRLRASRQGIGDELGTVASEAGKQDAPAAAHDA